MKKLYLIGVSLSAALLPLLTHASSLSEITPRIFKDAKWICPASLHSLTNATMEFRTTFDSPQRNTFWRLALAADTVYSIKLNGSPEYETGRFPDVPPMRFYDVLTLANIKEGTNELIIRLYSQGDHSSQYIPGDPGLAFDLFSPTTHIVSNEKTPIQFRRVASYQMEGVPRISPQLGYSFIYDANQTNGTWTALTEKDCVRKIEEYELHRRPVPPSAIYPAIPTRIVSQGALSAAEIPTDIASGMDAAKITPLAFSNLFPNASSAALPSQSGLRVANEFLKPGFSVTIDLGREEVGLLDLKLSTDAGTVIDIGHAEHMENGRIQTKIGSRNFAGRYIAQEGLQTFCHWQRRMAGRFIQLQVRGAKTHFTLYRLSVKPVFLPMTEKAPPQGLTEREQAIFRTSVRTLHLSMHEHYEDCPWREQSLYANDARNQILAGAYAFENAGPFAALSLELLGRGLDPNDGWIEICMPAKLSYAIPSFTFAWALAVRDHWEIYHDRATATKLFPILAAILNQHISEMKEDLLPCPRGARYWHFYDWMPGLWGHDQPKENQAWFDSPLNLFFALALDAGEKMARDLDHTQTAAEWKQARTRLVAAIRTRFWDNSKNEFKTSIGKDVPDAPACELSQALALLTGAAPEEKSAALAARLSAPSSWTETTLSQSIYKYEALMQAGKETAQKARDAINATWGAMLDAGATSFWEVKEGWKAFDNAGSLCHGWSAIPAYFYGKYPRE